MDTKEEKKAWKEVRIGKRFLNAGRGMYVFYKTSSHFFIFPLGILAVAILGIYFKISATEWTALVLATGFFIVSEVFNTAIEIDIDLTSPGYHPFARDTKDVSAAAVILSLIVAILVGCIVFLPKLF